MSFVFFLCGGKEIIHCFRNIFRNPSTTTAPASATCISHITLPRASATLFSWFLLPRPQRHYVFQGFWLWLNLVGFISFHFGLLGAFICFHFWLWGRSFVLEGIRREYRCLGMCFFRGASAKLPRGFRETPKQNR